MEAKMEGKGRYVITNPSIREGAVSRAKNEETSEIIVVATPLIREGAVSAANNEETSIVMVATPSSREGTATDVKKRPAQQS